MDHLILSRIDRAVADNIKDIERSFGTQAGLVQDFIVFISRQLKIDLFGYTRFTLKSFCECTGRNRQDLSLIHPDFASGKKQPPVIQGFAFSTIMDFALYSMMERNIIFSNKYEVKGHNSIIQMQSFPILKDLKLNFERHSKEQKIYDVRLSDELLNGFLSRYYTVNTESYRLVGKGRGGDSRKKLLIYLSKLSHVLASGDGYNQITVPIDRLCSFGDINDLRASHKKQNLIRMLDFIRNTGKLAFEYEFVSQFSRYDYHVKLVFQPVYSKRVLQAQHTFYLRLLSGLKSVFDSRKDKAALPVEEDPFQAWLGNKFLDTDSKAQILVQAYYIAYNINISQSYAVNLILSNEILTPLADVK